MWTRLKDRANEPWDASGLAALRVLFGLVMLGSVWRYFANGWVDAFFVMRTHPLSHFGFEWVRPLPEPWTSALFVVAGLAAACIALGLLYRVATVAFFLSFTYLHLVDVANYLNHYHLVSVLALLLCVLPLHRALSVDAWLRPSLRASTLPAWTSWLLRAQVALVYFFAGLANLGPDWLLHGQPLGIWLSARTDTPLVGPLLGEPSVALAASWAGFLFDTTIVGWLLWKRTRPFAYALVCVFHLFTHLWFNIGIFPFVMTAAATVFLDPAWPRTLVARLRRVPLRPALASDRGPRIGTLGLALVGLYLLAHVAVPLRSHLYGGDVLWHEQGMRWSWRVMVREKTGSVTYRVRVDGEPRERIVRPRQYLDAAQESELVAQPDLVLQLAHRIAGDLRAAGHRDVEVRADAFVSLNGRPSARIVDPAVDLSRVSDGLAPATWILPAPQGPPLRVAFARPRVAMGGAP